MAFPTTKEFAALEARVVELERRLGVGQEKAVPVIDDVLSLSDFFGPEDADLLLSGKFKTVDAVKFADDEALLAVKGLGPAALARIREKSEG